MENGIGSAVEQVVKLTRETRKTEILPATLEPQGYYYLVGPDGASTKVLAQPAWHRETLQTPSELRNFIAANPGGNSAVFVGPEQVVFVYDMQDRRNVAVCPLKTSPQYQLLLSPPQQMSQSDFIRLLRIPLHGCLTSENLIPLLRELKFESGDIANTTIQHGRESMGRQINSAVTGVDKIPDEIGLLIPVFENHAYTHLIKCAVEVFSQERTFRLTPYPLQLKTAMEAALTDIADVFVEDLDVFHGKP
jgi:hypothetical protein